MRTVVYGMVCLLGLTLFTGCIESTMLLRVEKDGSGTILLREFVNVDSMPVFGAEMGDAAAEMLKTMFDEKMKMWGDSVELVEHESMKNARGWTGYQARLSFSDVTQVRLGTEGENEAGELTPDVSFHFEFEPGDPATLRVVPVGDALEQLTEDTEGEADPQDAGMDAMMATLFDGMKMGVYVQVAGKIVETDASYPDPKRDNVVALMDIDFGKLMSNDETKKIFMSQRPDSMKQLLSIEDSGYRIEDSSRPITIKF